MIRRLAACLLALLLLSQGALAAKPETGSIRVKLSLPQGATQIEVGIYGSYLLNDTLSFQRGSSLKILAQQANLMVYYEGLIYRAGPTIQLRRYGAAQGSENGLRLDGGLNLYEGDLRLNIEDGQLQAILHIGIEDYLKGVVPYEMADSFPLEALKAQAVTARGYALRSLRSERDFDVYDSTRDQVYRGLGSDHVNALRAVRETAGQALKYKGELAQTYYSASNGGQTETAFNAWGRERLPYTRLAPDPYDIENPASQMRSFAINKLWAPQSTAEQALDNMLHQGLLPQLQSMGLTPDPNAVKIREIIGLEAVKPRFDAPSLLMTGLRFDLLISTRKPAEPEGEANLFSVSASPEPAAVTSAAPGDINWGHWQDIAKPVQVELPIFTALEQALGLSINAKDNEIVSVVENDRQFILESRRYGHGVGMSQRGAEWMAKTYGWNHQQILAFYYPGTELAQYETQPTARQMLAPSFLTTPGPKPTATPRPTLVPLPQQTPEPGQRIVSVTGVARNSSLNLREQPSLSSPVLYQLFYGQQLLVLEELEGGWLRVMAQDLEGYVMASYVGNTP